MDAKERIYNFLKEKERAGIEDLLAYMDECGFYDAPCSSRFHYSKPGGLAEHSLNVLNVALSLVDAFYMEQKERFDEDFINSIIICSLLHDLGKMGQFNKPGYILNNGSDAENAPYKANKELLYIPHEVRSIAIISRFTYLTEEEQFAILYHNGLYGELKSIKGNETPLYMILHFADMWASRVVEKE